MSGFLSGAAVDCGPSNVLKNVGGRMERDVSMQQDRFVSAPTAGSTRRAFGVDPRVIARDQAQQSGSARGQSSSAVPFDMSSLRNHLIPSQPTVVSPPPPVYANAQWAGSFRPDQAAGPSIQRYSPAPLPQQSTWAASYQPIATTSTPRTQHMSPDTIPQQYQPRQFYPSYQQSAPSFYPSITNHHQYHDQMMAHPPAANEMSQAWPTAADFDTRTAEDKAVQQEESRQDSEMEEPLPEVNWQDDTPADLEAMLRMQPTIPEILPLRPGATQETIPRSDINGYSDQSALLMSDPSSSTSHRRKSVHFQPSGVPSSLEEALAHSATSIPGVGPAWEEALLEFSESNFDEEAFMAYNGPMGVARDVRLGVGQMEGWGEMQNDWEDLQRTLPKGETRGADGRYLFQSRNPYNLEEAIHDKDMGMEGRSSPTARGVLELEAAVQADPTDHQAWYTLGLKQQENERESAAILALAKVVQLDPDYRPAYLALAVSYTNEGELPMANKMIGKWIDLAPSASQLSAGTVGQGEEGDWREGQKVLVDRLIGLARMSPDELDPDVQVALGVLFNSGEQFDKAEDCLLAALSVRPNDWLLYNRIGATLANSGRSNEALEYYHKALALHPNFIRALFNMGISYINLSQYSLAAQRILDALRLQQADATEGYAAGTVGNAAKGVTSETLWNTLRSACLHMGRSDLVALATRRDLGGFPGDLTPGGA